MGHPAGDGKRVSKPALVAMVVLGALGSLRVDAQTVNQTDSCSAHATDRAPNFRIAKRRPLSGRGLQIFVSVAPKDITQASLLLLGCRLGRKHRKEPFLMVWFLDDYHAAKVWELGAMEPRVSDRGLRGSYSFSRDDGTHELIWFPDQDDHSRHVKVNLGNPPPEQ
jgi:hypothetical protein